MGNTLKEKAEKEIESGNPSQLGDPVSLKAENSDRTPTESEKGAKGAKDGTHAKDGHKTLKQVAQESNPTMLGDPVSLKAETSDSEPTDQDRGARHDKKRDSKI